MAMAAASNAQRSSALEEYRCSIYSKIFDRFLIVLKHGTLIRELTIAQKVTSHLQE
jgi:hypothetical protein